MFPHALEDGLNLSRKVPTHLLSARLEGPGREAPEAQIRKQKTSHMAQLSYHEWI